MLWHQVGRLPAGINCLEIDSDDSNLPEGAVAQHCAVTVCVHCLQAQSGPPFLHSPSHLRWYAHILLSSVMWMLS